MAKSSGATVPEFKAQLGTTAMFYKAADAVAFTRGPQLKKTMEYVRTFSFDKELFGQRAKSKDFVGIAFPDGTRARRPEEREAALHRRLHEAGRRRQAVGVATSATRYREPQRRPASCLRWTLGLLPFVVLVAVYLWASHLRLEENPQDKLLPSLAQMCGRDAAD